MTRISATIITLNEERNIRRCLISIQNVVDEIVVVDSGSTDNTEKICKEFKVRFLYHKFEGHIQQKNYAIDQCSFDWILALDADEALTPELTNSIEAIKNREQGRAFSMNRLTNYCGQWIKHSGWYPDRKTRLFLKSSARWGGVNPHDKIIVDSGQTVTHLQGDLLHYSYYEKEEHLSQIQFFSDIASKEMFESGRKTSKLTIYVKVVAKFVKSYIIRLGFLDGRSGFAIARYSAWATYLKYTKLNRLRKGL
jgi:glycosyltransferase involved in cell wall biosynthesis